MRRTFAERHGRLMAALRKRAARRGVSPIIATILLVAITVVLAAVLYVLISGLTGSTAAAPIALAPTVLNSGGGTSTWYVAVGVNPTATIATTAFGLKVTTSTTTATLATAVVGANCAIGKAYVGGTTCTGPAGTAPVWYAVLTNATGYIVSIYLTTSGAPAWSASVTISGGSFTVNVISSTQFDSQGYHLSAYGTGSASVSGSVNL